MGTTFAGLLFVFKSKFSALQGLVSDDEFGRVVTVVT